MARQPYETRLVLGRSAYQPPSNPNPADVRGGSAAISESRQVLLGSEPYIQQYDSQGHAQNARSRALARQSRRGQNDVLSTVRVCVHVDENGQPVTATPHLVRPTASEVRQENNCGVFVGAIDRDFFWLTALALVGLRQRLQTFRFYTEVSLLDIIKVEWKHLGLRNLLLPGGLATAWFEYIEQSRRKTLRRIFNGLTRRQIFLTHSPTPKRLLKMAIDVLEAALNVAVFALIAPLEIFSTLQRQSLTPDSVLLPRFWAMVPFSSLSPLQPWPPMAQITFQAFARALVSSPVFLLWLLVSAKSWAKGGLYVYIKRRLPKPMTPTNDSREAARDDDLTDGLMLDISEEDAYSERMGQHFRRAYLILMNIPARLRGWARLHGQRSTDESERAYGIIQTASESNTHPDDRDRAIDLSPTLDVAAHSHDAPNAQSVPVFDGSGRSASRMVEDARTPLLEGAPEWHHSNVAQAYPIPTAEVSRYDQPATYPSHHVTALTFHMADALAIHLSTHLTDFLFLPLEALFVRSVALGFLSAAASKSPSSPILNLRNQVIPPWCWFGMGIRPGGAFQYVKNLVFCGVFEVIIGLGVWQLSTGAAWYMGRKWFGWSKGEQDDLRLRKF